VAPARQGARLGPKFERLERALPNPAALAELREDPTAIVPERALVFEVASNVVDFYRAVRGVPGLEFLGEDEGETASDDDFVVLERGTAKPEKKVPRRFYLLCLMKEPCKSSSAFGYPCSNRSPSRPARG
jgi:hypothetical protein